MSHVGILLALLSERSFPCEWLRFLQRVLGDTEFLLVFPFGLAGMVTLALFGVERVLQGFGRNDRSL
jgi:hypothetical protein